MRYLPLYFLVVAAPALLGAAPTTVPSEREKIEHLIRYVGGLKDAVFIRNGSQYTPAEAADHMRTKLQAAGTRVKTAKEFIDLAASRSSVSGQEYRVRFRDGKTVTSGELLKAELGKLEPTTQPGK